jgi:hypothetical protein
VIIFFFLGLLTLPSMITLWNDPAPGLITSYESSRRYNCERATLESARRAYPGLLEDQYPRGDFIERSAVLCTEPIVGVDVRHKRDAAILGGLTPTVRSVASRIAAEQPEKTWLVEVHYPNAAVVAKVAFAAKAALVESGVPVTDRLPTLATGDVDVLSRTPALKAHALACRRYFATGRLEGDDAVLSLLVLDSRETALHAGICINGAWTWLQ